MNIERAEKLGFIFYMIFIFFAILVIIYLPISIFIDDINDSTEQIEYTYKGFTSDDITLAMKFHGVTSVTITEFKCYFVNSKGDTINVFTDKCIEHLYKQKQREMRKVGE